MDHYRNLQVQLWETENKVRSLNNEIRDAEAFAYFDEAVKLSVSNKLYFVIPKYSDYDKITEDKRIKIISVVGDHLDIYKIIFKDLSNIHEGEWEVERYINPHDIIKDIIMKHYNNSCDYDVAFIGSIQSERLEETWHDSLKYEKESVAWHKSYPKVKAKLPIKILEIQIL